MTPASHGRPCIGSAYILLRGILLFLRGILLFLHGILPRYMCEGLAAYT